MIEISLDDEKYIRFIAEAKKQMSVRGIGIRALARKINRPYSTVYSFFSKSGNHSRFIAAEIAKVLEIKL